MDFRGISDSIEGVIKSGQHMLNAGCGLIIFLSLALVALLGVLAYLLATR